MGSPLCGWNAPVALEQSALMAAPDGWLPVRIGIGLWLPSLVANERTTAKRSALWASLGKVPPNQTPGMLVRTSPVQLRLSEATFIFGSKVSICGGPPCRNRKTIDLFLKTLFSNAACDLAAWRLGIVKPPKLPIRRKSRRLNEGPWENRRSVMFNID